MGQDKNETSSVALETIVTNAVKIPGVKVNRNKFLAETFSNEGVDLQSIVDMGPVSAGVSQERIEKLAAKLIFRRTSQSSIASFVAGIPGGLAMAATIPADILQFFGMALRLAQELSYLYGASDLWKEDQLDDDRVRNQLILYCGVMFGVSGAVSGVRLLSTQIAKTTLKKLPQKALTKTFWYPIVKQIGKAIGIKITKTTVAQGISKAVPVVGGVISGGLNYASMMPMANRLNNALDQACFDYSEEDMVEDIEIIENMDEEDAETPKPGKVSQAVAASKEGLNSIKSGFKKVSSGTASIINKVKSKKPEKEPESEPEAETGSESENVPEIERESPLVSYNEKIEIVRKLKGLLDDGILSQEEFEAKKKEILEL